MNKNRHDNKSITNEALKIVIEKHQSTLNTIKLGLIEKRMKMVVVLCCMLEKNLDDLLNREVLY